MRGRGIREAGEPVEFLWKWICTTCRKLWDAAKDERGVIASVPCPGCGAEDEPGSRLLTYELADPSGIMAPTGRIDTGTVGSETGEPGTSIEYVGHPDDARLEGRSLPGCGRADERAAGSGSGEMADADREHGDNRGHGTGDLRTQRSEPTEVLGMRFAPGPSDPRWPAILRERPDVAPALESPIRRVADGLPDWMVEAMSDRTKRLGRLGNAVVPDCGEYLGRCIMEAEKRIARTVPASV
jgi:hypothetical protein